jgi:peptidoglycan biosynthesis protein MviN/MurJ (putative lipid II flippase)
MSALTDVGRDPARPLDAGGRVLRSMGWIVAFALAGRLAVAAREVVFAWRFGTDALLDAYLLVTTIVQWLPLVWAGIVCNLYVPLAARRAGPGRGDWEPRFVAELLGVALLAGAVLAVACAALLPPLARSGLLGLDGERSAIAASMAPWLSPLLPAGFVAGALLAVLVARERHVGTLAESVPALGVAIALACWPVPSAAPLVWGSLAGAAAQLALLGWRARREGLRCLPSPLPRSPAWRTFWRGLGVMALGQAAMSLVNVIDQVMAGGFGAGAIATLGYAQRLVGLATALGTIVIARAVLPVLATLVAGGANARALAHARRWAAWAFGAGVLGAATLWLAAEVLVATLLERGSFGAADTAAVAAALRAGALQLPAYLAGLVLVQLAAGRARHGLVAAVAGANLLVKVVANVVLAERLGVEGLLLATAVMYTFSFACFAWAAGRSTPAGLQDVRG